MIDKVTENVVHDNITTVVSAWKLKQATGSINGA